MAWENYQNEYPVSAFAELSFAVEDLQEVTRNTVHYMVESRARPGYAIHEVIETHRKHAQQLLDIAGFEHTYDEERSAIIGEMKKEIDAYWNEYNFYIAIADVYSHMVGISTSEDHNKGYAPLSDNLMERVIHKCMIYFSKWLHKKDIVWIIGEIDRIIANECFKDLPQTERDMWENKWKLYADKAQKY